MSVCSKEDSFEKCYVLYVTFISLWCSQSGAKFQRKFLQQIPKYVLDQNLPEIDHFSTDKIIFLVDNRRKFFSCLYWAYQWILGCIGLAEYCFLNKIPTISIWTSDNQHNLARASEASGTLNQSDELFECVWLFCRTRA